MPGRARSCWQSSCARPRRPGVSSVVSEASSRRLRIHPGAGRARDASLGTGSLAVMAAHALGQGAQHPGRFLRQGAVNNASHVTHFQTSLLSPLAIATPFNPAVA